MSDQVFQIKQAEGTTIVGTLHAPGATPGDSLVIESDHAVGVGAGGSQTVTVPVSSAEILDLANTPVAIVPGLPGFVTVVNGVAIVYVAGSTPYTDNGGGWGIQQRGALGYVWLSGNNSGFLDQATSKIQAGVVDNSAIVAPVVDEAGVDLVLAETAANVTDGDGTLLVTVSYFLAPTVAP